MQHKLTCLIQQAQQQHTKFALLVCIITFLSSQLLRSASFCQKRKNVAYAPRCSSYPTKAKSAFAGALCAFAQCNCFTRLVFAKFAKTSLLFRVAPLIPQNGTRVLWEPFCANYRQAGNLFFTI
jgi:hypothetical protein